MSAGGPRLCPWVLLPIVAVVAVVAFILIAFLTSGAAGPHPWPPWGFFLWFPFVGIGIAFGLLFLFSAFRWGAGPWGWGYGWDRADRDDSHAILRERYARGEITGEQFDRMRRDLDEHVAVSEEGGGRSGS